MNVLPSTRRGFKSPRIPNSPGRVYHMTLRCTICKGVDDYVQDILHAGPDLDRKGPWNYKLRKCPNCLRMGVTSFMEPSNK